MAVVEKVGRNNISFLLSVSTVLLALIISGEGLHPEDVDAGASMSASSDTLTLFLAAEADDENSGIRGAEPLKTMAEVQDQLRKRLEGQPRHTVVRVLPGVFRGESISWTFTMPDHSITFLGDSVSGRRPIFDGRRTAGQEGVGRGRHLWSQLMADDGSPMNLILRGLHVRNYEIAILIHGDRNDLEGWNEGNVVEQCVFTNIGDVADPVNFRWSPAAVDVINSRYNMIRNNTFGDIINTEKEHARLIHAVYLAHYSTANTIEENRFRSVSGDPVKARNFSNHKMARANRFERSGERALFSEWYCRRDVAAECTKAGVECAS